MQFAVDERLRIDETVGHGRESHGQERKVLAEEVVLGVTADLLQEVARAPDLVSYSRGIAGSRHCDPLGAS